MQWNEEKRNLELDFRQADFPHLSTELVRIRVKVFPGNWVSQWHKPVKNISILSLKPPLGNQCTPIT